MVGRIPDVWHACQYKYVPEIGSSEGQGTALPRKLVTSRLQGSVRNFWPSGRWAVGSTGRGRRSAQDTGAAGIAGRGTCRLLPEHCRIAFPTRETPMTMPSPLLSFC